MIVVDTNIIVPLFIHSAESEAALALRAKDDVWRTEPFALIEIGNALATYVRGKHLAAADAARLLQEAQRFLRPYFHPIPDENALALALRHGTTAYDGRFLAVAEALGLRLVTEDRRLRAAAPGLTQSLAEASVAD